MSDSFKICPICGASNHQSSVRCTTCGAILQGSVAASANYQAVSTGVRYDFHHGETDLLEESLRDKGRSYLIGAIGVLLASMMIGFVLALLPGFLSDNAGSVVSASTTTPRPTSNLPTVTVGPPTQTPSTTPTPLPTATATPTPEPCIVTVQANDTLIGVISACGHTAFGDDLLQAVQATNVMSGPQDIRPGDVLEIPWPTPTNDPNLVPTEVPADASENGEGETVTVLDPSDEDFDPFFVPTATLQPGIMFHTVQPGEDIITIAVQYGANLEILSQLNPEIAFSQCDFGEDFGGERCSVFLAANQRVRVPAPTALPTLSPTPSGSETPTPTPTPTFNAPSIVSPSDRALFLRDELVTLRWIGSGILADGDMYRLRVENVNDGIVYTVDSRENSFILPLDWQGNEDRRYEFQWSVSLVQADDLDTSLYTTPVRTFSWEGQGS